MSFLSRLFARKDEDAALRPLYAAAVAHARAEHWYLEGGVADTIDGRFDMVAAVLSVVLLRLEALDARAESARLTELFIEDMDGQIRQIGFGDVVVGKQIGHMVGALGGRLAAYRAGFAGEAPLEDALRRNLYRGGAPSEAQLAHVTARLRAFAALLATRDLTGLIAAPAEA